MKCSINSAEPTQVSHFLEWSVYHFLILFFQKFAMCDRSCLRIRIVTVTIEATNHYPMFTNLTACDVLMIAKLNLGKLGTKSAGKDPIYWNLSSGIRSIMSRNEVLSMKNKFSLLYLTSIVCTMIPDRAIKLKTFVLLREATIFGFLILSTVSS